MQDRRGLALSPSDAATTLSNGMATARVSLWQFRAPLPAFQISDFGQGFFANGREAATVHRIRSSARSPARAQKYNRSGSPLRFPSSM